MALGLRIAVLGAGRIGSAHAAIVRDHPDVADVVLIDTAPGLARQVADDLGVSCAPRLGAAGLVDGVLVATSTSTHAAALDVALPLGVPVFCEKPVALDVATTRRVLRTIDEIGATVQIGFQRRFDVGYVTARQLVRSGVLGEVHRAHTLTCDPSAPPEPFVRTSGGIFLDCMVHDIDALRWTTGREIVRVFAVGAHRGPDYIGMAGDVDEACVALELDDGTVATAQVSRLNGAGYDVRMELAGTAGTAVVGLDARVPLTVCEPGVEFPPPGRRWGSFWERFLPAYRAEVRAFVDLIAGHGGNPCPPGEALAALLVARAATVSCAERRPIDVAEIFANE